MTSFARRCVTALRGHLARRGEWYWAPLLYTLAAMWIYRELWHQRGVATGFGWDTIDMHGPDLDWFSRELREGRFSLWNPYDKGGYPVFCDPIADRYYPFNWPFASWGALFGTSWWLVQIKVFAHHVVAGSCLHLFVRSRGLPVRAAMIGGLGLLACSPMLVHKASHIPWPMAWVPLVWLAIDRALARPSWRRGAGVAAAFLLCSTPGTPPGLFYSALLIVPYAVVRAVQALRDPERRRRAELRQLLVCVGTAIAVAGLALAVTVLPTSALVAVGSREHIFVAGREFALANSTPLPVIARGVLARGVGTFEFYMGSVVLLLAACALVTRPCFDRGAAIVFAAIASVAVVLAAGATTPLLPWLVDHVPGFALLRIPSRYKLVMAWALAAAAAYGAGALAVADAKTRRRATWCALGAIAVVAIVIVAWGARDAQKDRSPWWSFAMMASAAAIVIATVHAPRRWTDLGLSALALLALVDGPTLLFLPTSPPAAEPRQTHDHDAEVVARLDGARDRWRVYDEFVLGERAGTRLGIRDFRGYPAIEPLTQLRYLEVLEYAKREPAIITDYNVRWLLVRPHFRYGYDTSFVHVPDPHFVARGSELWEALHPAPLVSWLGSAVVRERARVLPAVRAIEEPDGARRRAVLEPGDAARLPAGALDRLVAAPPDARDGRVERYTPDEIRFTVDAPRDGVVVLNELAFDGWQVEVDGEPATALRANYLLRAVWVDAGHHTIVWRFELAGWRLLVGGYLLALAIIVAAAVWPRRRSRS